MGGTSRLDLRRRHGVAVGGGLAGTALSPSLPSPAAAAASAAVGGLRCCCPAAASSSCCSPAAASSGLRRPPPSVPTPSAAPSAAAAAAKLSFGKAERGAGIGAGRLRVVVGMMSSRKSSLAFEAAERLSSSGVRCCPVAVLARLALRQAASASRCGCCGCCSCC